MANVRDSDTSLWLHNKLGTSNDSWISGSICSQLNKEVLRNIKECFPDLQTQVKLKLLLSFFHIPRRLVEEWKTELEEILEVAGVDSELWVSMLAETMKTFPATGSLNTEISEYEDNRPIFTDMVNDIKKLVSKSGDLGMLPLECQYLNKAALVSVVGQQPNPVQHFALKRQTKSHFLRKELLQKCEDAMSSLKKASAPTIPLRSRGMPRKMTDTTPLKGIPSRMPTSTFRSPNVLSNQQRPNLSRTAAGRKDGGIKLIEFTEQPLGYAAAKKRKREQQLEEQQKKQEQKQIATNVASTAGDSSPTSTLPSKAASTGAAVGTPSTPTSANTSFVEIKTETPQLGNESIEDLKPDIQEPIEPISSASKSESLTPDYAPPALTYTQPTAVTVGSNNALHEPKTVKTNASISSLSVDGSTTSKISNASILTQSNNVGYTSKRIKQEIEIKSEEILVPANIKLEKIETHTQPTFATTQNIRVQPSQIQQQRIVIQQQSPQKQQLQQQQQQHVLVRTAPQQPKQTIGGVTLTSTTARSNTNAAGAIKMEKLEIRPTLRTTTNNSNAGSMQQLRTNPLANLPNNISVKITSTKPKGQQQQQQQQQPILINNNTPVILASSPTQTVRQQKQITATSTSQSIKSMPLSQLKSATNSGPVIISQTIIQPAKRTMNNSGTIITHQPAPQQQQQQHQQQQTQINTQQPATQYILTSSAPQQQSLQQQNTTIPTLTSFVQRPGQQTTTLYQTTNNATANPQTPTKILLKTSPSSGVVMTPMRQQTTMQQSNPPPLIAASTPQQQTLLNIQNVQLPNRPVTIQPASQAAQQQHLQAQLQQQQHTIVSNTTATQQPKLGKILVQSNPSSVGGLGLNQANMANKTIFLTQKGIMLRNIGGDMYEQIPISNVGGLQNISAGTTLVTTSGPPSLVKTSPATPVQQQTIQIQQQPTKQHLPTLIPTNTLNSQHLIVQQQPTNISPSQQTIIRPVMSSMQSNVTTLPQGLTFIQRPGQQPQLVQVQSASATQTAPMSRAIITQTTQQQRPQQIVLQQKQPTQRIITTANANSGTQQIQIQQSNATLPRSTQIVQVQQTQTQTQQQQQQTQTQAPPQRKGLSLSTEHFHKAHEMFSKANRVTRSDKVLILAFMSGLRENPRPNPENVIVIKLNENEEKVQQDDGSTATCLVESFIRLDYNTGEWKKFQNYRRIDQSAGNQAGDNNASASGNVIQAQNSVVI